MAPGRGIVQSAILLVALAGITVAEANEEQLPRYKFRHSSSNQHPSEWIAGPNGYLYQFHIGEQSWLAAREFCLAENADLVSIKSKDQLDWILQHYAPTHPSFDERYVQIGLVSVGDSSEFSWVYGSKADQSIIEWATVPTEGNRCSHLKVNEKKVESIDCDAAGSTLHINRFVCQRSTTVHQEQQRSNNYIWRKLENLFNYFGLAENGSTPKAKRDEEDDYWQAVETLTEDEKKIFVETAKNLTAAEEPVRTTVSEVEGSGAEDKTIGEANSASREEKVVDEAAASGKKDEGVNAIEKKEEQKEIEETLTVVKEAKEEVKTETATLPLRKLKREEDDQLNKPLPLQELLDTEEGSGSSLTETANIESVPEDADLLASPTPSNEGDIDKMIERMEKLLDNMQGGEKKEIGPITIEKATPTPAPTATSTLIPIRPIVIEKAKEGLKVVDSAKEQILPEAESVETSNEKKEGQKDEKKKKEEEKKEEEKKDLSEDEDLLGNLERTTLASTENKKSVEDDHKEKLESDFTHENELEEMERLAEEVPTPKNNLNEGDELDCDEKEGNVLLESGDGEKKELSEEQHKQLMEFLGLLRVFLKTARHDDLRSVIDDNSNLSLIERMKKAIAIAKERKTEKQQLLSSMTPSEVDELEKKETASLMSDSEREEVYQEIKNAIKQGIMHDATTVAPEVVESTTEQPTTTVSVVEETTTVLAETTTVAPEFPTTREGRVRIRIRTLAEVMEEERVEKERAEKEAERRRLAGEKISGAVEEEVKKEKENKIIELRPLEDQEEIEQNEISPIFASPSRLRFAGVKTFVTDEDKKMIPVKDVDSISVLQSRELARKQKSDELRHRLEVSLAQRAAMREAVRLRNDQLKRKIEQEREAYFLSGRRVKRDADSEKEKEESEEAQRKMILEKEEEELEKLRKRLAEVREENDKLENDLNTSTESSTTTEKPKKKKKWTKQIEKKTTRVSTTSTTTDPTTTRPLSAFEKKMDTNHLLDIISKMEREKPTVIDRSGVTSIDRVFNNLGQEMHELLVG